LTLSKLNSVGSGEALLWHHDWLASWIGLIHDLKKGKKRKRIEEGVEAGSQSKKMSELKSPSDLSVTRGRSINVPVMPSTLHAHIIHMVDRLTLYSGGIK
jgi:hypothetical protein